MPQGQSQQRGSRRWPPAAPAAGPPPLRKLLAEQLPAAPPEPVLQPAEVLQPSQLLCKALFPPRAKNANWPAGSKLTQLAMAEVKEKMRRCRQASPRQVEAPGTAAGVPAPSLKPGTAAALPRLSRAQAHSRLQNWQSSPAMRARNLARGSRKPIFRAAARCQILNA